MTRPEPIAVEMLAYEGLNRDEGGSIRWDANPLADDWAFGVLTANYQTLWALIDGREIDFELP